MLNVVKIGGNIVDNPEALGDFLDKFAAMPGQKMLVHGGGKEATRLSKDLGLSATMIDGRRVTDARTLEIVTMVYAGLINKRIVSALQARGCNAVGLSGADGNSICARRRSPLPVDYGFVGDISPEGVNAGMLSAFIDAQIVPVSCAICHDGAGTLLNCNADSVAAALALAMSRHMPVRLNYCFEKPGVLADVNDDESVIPLITPVLFEEMMTAGTVAAGMIPKLQNALQCAREGVAEVRICHAADILADKGTIIRAK